MWSAFSISLHVPSPLLAKQHHDNVFSLGIELDILALQKWWWKESISQHYILQIPLNTVAKKHDTI